MTKIFCIALILFAYIGAFAQEKTITKSEFDTISKNFLEKWRGKQHRMTVTTQSGVEGRPETDYSSKTVFEYGSTNVRRFIYENTFNSINKRTEIITIADKMYERKGNEQWREVMFAANASSSQTENKSSAVNNQGERQIEYKFLGTEKLNNQTANVYGVYENAKSIDAQSGKEALSTTVTKYWFGEDGLILKSDRITENRSTEKITHFRLTMAWELDSNIKIEAPNLNQTK